tara:strand:+ start:244 stop:1158 length:915 start_codon:yes stop_codon:yes gene_type:complete
LSKHKNLEIRNFKWNDLEAFQRLLNAIGMHGHKNWPANVQNLTVALNFPRVQPERNIALVHDGIDIVAYAIVEPEVNIGRSVIGFGSKSTDIEILKNLVNWGTHVAAKEAPIAHVPTKDNQTQLENFLRQIGATKVRTYLKLLSTNTPKTSALIPNGYKVRTMIGISDIPNLTEIQNAAFTGHFGYSPNTEDEVRYRILSNDFAVENISFIQNSCEQFVAYCWSDVYERKKEKIGRIEMTGVRPEFRRKGLGKTIIEVCCNQLIQKSVKSIELDVDSNNTAAIKVYKSLGFAEVSRISWWELIL